MSMPCQKETAENAITVGIATTLREKRKIYRLRYRVYVEEMAMKLDAIDHANKLLYDEMDQTAVLLYAQCGSEVIGTMRINIGRVADLPPDLARILCLERFENYYEGGEKGVYAYTGKLMVAPEYRNSVAMFLLMVKGYEIYCQYGVKFSFGVCNFHLLRLYEQLGYRRYGGTFVADGYDGVLSSIVMLIDDVDHLRAVRSPFYRPARKRGLAGDGGVSEWFGREFPEQAGIINSQLVGEDELWDIVSKQLKKAPNEAMPLLRGLSSAEARRFLHECGLIMPCRPGDYLARQGFTSHTLKVLLSGRVRTLGTAGAGGKIVRPGQCFSTAGLIEQPRYTEDAYAVTSAEVLVLSRLGFQRFQHSHPDVAAKISRNIDRLTGYRYHADSDKRQTAK